MHRPGRLATVLASALLLLALLGAAPAAAEDSAGPVPVVAATIPVGRDAASVAIDASGVWVTAWYDNTLWRIDPATNAVVAKVTLAVPGSGGPEAIESGFGSLWVTTTEWDDADKTLPGYLLRVDPASGIVSATIPVGRNAWRLAVGAGAVWVANADDGTLMRIDPSTNAIAATIAIAGITDVAASGDAVWAAREDGSLARIDPAANAVAQTATTDAKWPLVAVGGGSVWVASDKTTGSPSARLLRLDPLTGSVIATAVLPGTSTGDVAVAGSSVWVAMWDAPSVVQVAAATGSVLATVPVSTSWAVSLAATERDAWTLGYTSEPFVGTTTPSGIVTRISLRTAPPPPSITWKAAVGASGANGTATFSTSGSTGTLRLALKGLKPSAAYAVAVLAGTCAKPGTTLWRGPIQTSTSKGRIAKVLAIPGAKVAAIRVAGAVGPVSLRIGTGVRLRCGLLTPGPAVVAPSPSPTPTPSTSATPAPTPTPTGTAFVGPYFSIVLPVGWRALPPDADTPADTVLYAGPSSQAIGVSSCACSVTLEAAILGMVATLDSTLGATVERTDDVTVGGVPGKMLVAHGTTSSGANVHVLWAVVVNQGRVYNILFMAPPGNEAADRTLVVTALASFQYRSAP